MDEENGLEGLEGCSLLLPWAVSTVTTSQRLVLLSHRNLKSSSVDVYTQVPRYLTTPPAPHPLSTVGK